MNAFERVDQLLVIIYNKIDPSTIWPNILLNSIWVEYQNEIEMNQKW